MTLIVYDHTPQRIVSLQPSATVILAAIGGLDRLVACTKYCADVCPEVGERKLAIVHDSWTADTKQITGAQPDLVIAAVPYQEKAVTEILRTGSRFLGLAPKTLFLPKPHPGLSLNSTGTKRHERSHCRRQEAVRGSAGNQFRLPSKRGSLSFRYPDGL